MHAGGFAAKERKERKDFSPRTDGKAHGFLRSPAMIAVATQHGLGCLAAGNKTLVAPVPSAINSGGAFRAPAMNNPLVDDNDNESENLILGEIQLVL